MTQSASGSDPSPSRTQPGPTPRCFSPVTLCDVMHHMTQPRRTRPCACMHSPVNALYCTLPALGRDSAQLIIFPSFQSYQWHIELYYVAGISIWVRFGVSPNEEMGATGTIVVADNKGATQDSYIELVSLDTEYHLTSPLTSMLISLVYYLQKKLLLLLNSQVSHNLIPCTLYANCVQYNW